MRGASRDVRFYGIRTPAPMSLDTSARDGARRSPPACDDGSARRPPRERYASTSCAARRTRSPSTSSLCPRITAPMSRPVSFLAVVPSAAGPARICAETSASVTAAPRESAQHHRARPRRSADRALLHAWAGRRTLALQELLSGAARRLGDHRGLGHPAAARSRRRDRHPRADLPRVAAALARPHVFRAPAADQGGGTPSRVRHRPARAGGGDAVRRSTSLVYLHVVWGAAGGTVDKLHHPHLPM
mgnify:CR=1 FL=1